MDTVCSSKTVKFYQIAWHHIPEDSTLCSHTMRTSHLMLMLVSSGMWHSGVSEKFLLRRSLLPPSSGQRSKPFLAPCGLTYHPSIIIIIPLPLLFFHIYLFIFILYISLSACWCKVASAFSVAVLLHDPVSIFFLLLFAWEALWPWR